MSDEPKTTGNVNISEQLIRIDPELKDRYLHITEPVICKKDTCTVTCGLMASKRVTVVRCVLGDFKMKERVVIEPVSNIVQEIDVEGNVQERALEGCTKCRVRESFFGLAQLPTGDPKYHGGNR